MTEFTKQSYISAAEAAALLGNDGPQILLAAHAEERIKLTGRILLDRARTAPDHKVIPKLHVRNRVLNVQTNELEADAATKDFRKFELDQGLARWIEVSVSNADLAKLRKYLSSPAYISALAQKKCAEWLMAELPTADAALTKREEVWKSAKDQFQGLPRRAFIRIWNQAIKDTGRSDLSAGGRKPTKR